MNVERESHSSLLAEYTAALARQGAEWKSATDTGLGAVERVIAYARWLAASQRVQSLSARISEGDSPIQASRP